jgi:hypothetical protein
VRDKAVADWKEAKRKWEIDNQSWTDYGLALARKLIRTPYMMFSTSLYKLSAAAFLRYPEAPYDESVATGLSFIPGISKIAAGAPVWGGRGFDSVLHGVARGLTTGFYDSLDYILKHHSELSRYPASVGKADFVLDIPGSFHAAIKAPAARMAYEKALFHSLKWETEQGYSANDPEVIERSKNRAVIEAYRAVLMEDNVYLSAWREVAKYIDRNTTGHSIAETVQTGITPIARVPFNFTGQTLERLFGAITGSVGASKMLIKGVEKFTPEEKDLVMRRLTKGVGGIGGLALVGFFGAYSFGGLRQWHGKKREEWDVKEGAVKTPLGTIPPVLGHNTAEEVIQFFAQVRRNYDALTPKGDSEFQGLPASFGAALLGLTDDLPPVRAAELYQKFHTSKGWSDFLKGQLGIKMMQSWGVVEPDAAAAKAATRRTRK